MHLLSAPSCRATPIAPRPLLSLLAVACALSAALVAGQAQAQSVALAGMMGNRPLLVINGGKPRAVAVGETAEGVKVVSVSGNTVVLQSNGERTTLRVGQSPIHLGGMGQSAPVQSDSGGTRIVLTQGSGGHFFGSGAINGRAMQFVVDTGATSVAMSVADAQRMGIKYQDGTPMRVNTANGMAAAWRVTLNSVRIGNVTVYDVQGSVVNSNLSPILLGNSFLNRFTMTRNGEQMILERRY